jgi:hypothetical protein
MAETSLTYQVTKAKIDAIVLDASVSETHTAEVEVTEHPVEQGVNIIDHARVKPRRLTIEGLISATPMAFTEAVAPQSSRGISFVAHTAPVGMDLVTRAYADLLKLRADGTLVTVSTGLETYQNMLIKSLVFPRNASIGYSLRFTAELVEVRIVQNKTVKLTAAPAAKPKVATEKHATTEAPKQADSWAKQIFAGKP